MWRGAGLQPGPHSSPSSSPPLVAQSSFISTATSGKGECSPRAPTQSHARPSCPRALAPPRGPQSSVSLPVVPPLSPAWWYPVSTHCLHEEFFLQCHHFAPCVRMRGPLCWTLSREPGRVSFEVSALGTAPARRPRHSRPPLLTVFPFPGRRVDDPEEFVAGDSLGVQVHSYWLPLQVLVGLVEGLEDLAWVEVTHM